MATNNTVLDEAVDSFQRKIVRSIAGTAFLVLGGAGAMAVPDLLSTTALSKAFESLRSDVTSNTERKNKIVSFGSMSADAQEAYAQQIEPLVLEKVESRPPTLMAKPAQRPRIMLASVEPTIPAPEASAEPAKPVAAAPATEINVLSPSLAIDQPLVMASIPAADMTPSADPATIANEIAAVIPEQVYQWPEGAKPVVAPPVETKKADAPPPPPPTPAEQLGLKGKDRVRAEKCLAQAIYFESRNEPVRGQIAVAQVVMNRVFSPYYPKDVCSVVFQNAHRLLGCQFTFACDGQPERITERGPWSRAQRIAKQTLDAKVWLPEVAKSTHYHASYVRPVWVREMKKMARYGLHTFYRPWRWGNGSDEPGWVKLPEKKVAAKT